MKRFKSPGQAQRFLSAHDGINNLFHLRRDHLPARYRPHAPAGRQHRAEALRRGRVAGREARHQDAPVLEEAPSLAIPPMLGGRAVGSRWSAHLLRHEGRRLLGGLWPSLALHASHRDSSQRGLARARRSRRTNAMTRVAHSEGFFRLRTVGEHGSHVRHEQNPNHSPCQNVHNLTP